MKALAEKEGFSVLDLLPFFSAFSAKDLWVYPTDQHPNELGHRLAAQAMVETLKSELADSVARNRRTAPPPAEVPQDEWWHAFRSQPIEAPPSDTPAGSDAPRPGAESDGDGL